MMLPIELSCLIGNWMPENSVAKPAGPDEVQENLWKLYGKRRSYLKERRTADFTDQFSPVKRLQDLSTVGVAVLNLQDHFFKSRQHSKTLREVASQDFFEKIDS